MKTNKYYLLVALMIALFAGNAFGQEIIKARKVLGKPRKFERPIGFNDLEKTKEFIEGRDKRTKNMWIVISDRDNNTVYDKPNGKALDFKINFKDYFYVIGDNKKGWIHIAKIEPKPHELKIRKRKVWDYGWVEKSKMLLWTDGLISPNSGIHQKAFLLNRAEDIKNLMKLNKNIAAIYTGPTGDNRIAEKNIYEFYFIMKKEERRYLIAKESKISTSTIDDGLVGWVDATRLEEWNTRVALEPNFAEEAFEERKSNKDFQLVGYDEGENASFHSDKGIPHTNHIFWDNDPVKLPPQNLDKETKRRFKGTVVRFPLFKRSGDIVRTGVIGNINIKSFEDKIETISEIEYSAIQKRIEEMKINNDNCDILFFVDATKDMEFTKISIANVIKRLMEKYGNLNFRFGIALYRDVYDKPDMLKLLPLTSDIDKLNANINSLLFGSSNDFDDYTCIHDNLKQAILRAGFIKEHTNIIIALGGGADYRASTSRRLEAKKNNEKTFIKTGELVKLLSDFNINLSFVQVINKGSEPYRRFLDQGKYITLETAKNQFALYRNIGNYVPDLSVKNPSYNRELSNQSTIKLEGGTTQSFVSWSQENNRLKSGELYERIFGIIRDILDYRNELINTMTNTFVEGRSFDTSAGSFSAPIGKFLNEIMKDDLNKDMVKKILKEKYKLYTEIFLPLKIKGAEHPTTSYVLFMPHRELVEYLEQLEKLAVAYDMDVSEQRKELYSTLVQLINQYSGFDLSKRELKKVSLNDLRAKMEGLYREGLQESKLFNFNISDILNDRKMKDDEVFLFVESIVNKIKELKKIESMKGKYEFSYTSHDNVYYWIPMDYTL